MPTIEIRVSGKVQGVFYRASTREQATALKLTGWVRNLPDGSVLIRVTGPTSDLQQLEGWCRRGPRGAHVTDLLVQPLPDESFEGFQVIR